MKLLAVGAIAAVHTVASAGCSLTAAPLTFGNISVPSAKPVDSIGSIVVRCTGGVHAAYQIALGSGMTGSFSPRRLHQAGGRGLSYNVYTDATRRVVWGDGTGGTSVVEGLLEPAGHAGASRTHPVYGRIFEQQRAPAGAYSDAVLVRLDF